CNLTLSEIMEIVFMFVIEIPLIQAAELTGRSNKTITDWYNLCREVCTAVIKKKTKMLGTHANPIHSFGYTERVLPGSQQHYIVKLLERVS
ncbi:THAP-type domain-containing protein, partial [Aphis craccivora]